MRTFAQGRVALARYKGNALGGRERIAANFVRRLLPLAGYINHRSRIRRLAYQSAEGPLVRIAWTLNEALDRETNRADFNAR